MAKRPIGIGDRVAYSAVWLRSTGTHTGEYPFLRGTVAALDTLSPGFTLATVDWGGGRSWPVNTGNLTLVSRITVDAVLADRVAVGLS